MTAPIMPTPRPALGFIGAGRVARALAIATARAGYAVTAIASRTPAGAQSIADAVPGCAVVVPDDIFAHADLVFLSVPDDAIATCAQTLRPAAHQALVHCSGASEVALLTPAATSGAQIGGFHPLFLFAGLPDDATRLAGAAITIEAPTALANTLQTLAQDIGCRGMTIAAGERMRYHAGANYAASFLLCLLDEAAQLWQAIGMTDADARAALWPLVDGTLSAARERGLPGALAGPVSRGDAGIVQRHATALAAMGDDHAALYAMLTQRAVGLARQRPVFNDAALQAIDDAIQPHLPKPPTA